MSPEQLVIDYLDKKISGIRAYAVVPSNRDNAFITVERTGGQTDRFFDWATLAVQVWAPTIAKTSALCFDVKKALIDLAKHPQVGDVSINSSYYWPDPEVKVPRYQIVVDMMVKI